MDAGNFDSLAKRFADPQSRRGLLGGALGVLAGVLGGHEGEAKRKRHDAHTPSRKDKQRKNKRKRQGSQAEVVQNGCAHLCLLIFPKDKRGQQQCLAFAESHPTICTCLSFCRQVYRTNLSQQLACLKAATKGSGICLDCGADPERFCHGTCCTAPQTCGGGGTPNVCGRPACVPTTCAAQSKNCGSIPDGCGGTISCGACQTVDFSTHGEGPFQADFYKKDGVTFTAGSFVGFVQGDEAIIGDIAGTFTPPVSSLSVRVAPGFQGTFPFTLTALDASSTVIASESVTVTEDGSGGYVTIDLGVLPAQATYFTLTGIPDSYGVSSITYATTRKTR